MGKIAVGLEVQGISSPTGKLKWNWETLNKLMSNEKYTGRVLLQKTINVGNFRMKNESFMNWYLSPNPHAAIISDEIFKATQQEKFDHAKNPNNAIAIDLTL